MQNTNFDNIDILKELENSYEVQTLNVDNIEKKIYETIEYIYSPKKIIKRNSFVSWIIFLSKYILTSTLIFAVLLVTTNYSAYINIAKSYFFSGQLQATSQKLISSVEASNIKEKYAEVKREEIKEEKEDYEKHSIKKMKKEQDKESLNLNIEITPYENRIIIPKIGKNIPLLEIKNRNINGEKELNDIFMKELENGIIRYPGSAKPWENGSSFIFGHSSIFLGLNEIIMMCFHF